MCEHIGKSILFCMSRIRLAILRLVDNSRWDKKADLDRFVRDQGVELLRTTLLEATLVDSIDVGIHSHNWRVQVVQKSCVAKQKCETFGEIKP